MLEARQPLSRYRGRPGPTVTESLDRAVDAVQNIVTDQIALLKDDVASAVGSATRRAAMVAAGGVLVVIGWMIALLSAHVALTPHVGGLNSLLLLAALNVLAGGVLVLAARRGSAVERDG